MIRTRYAIEAQDAGEPGTQNGLGSIEAPAPCETAGRATDWGSGFPDQS